MASQKIGLIADYLTRKEAERLDLEHEREWGTKHEEIHEILASREGSATSTSLETDTVPPLIRRNSGIELDPAKLRISRMASIRLSSAEALRDAMAEQDPQPASPRRLGLPSSTSPINNKLLFESIMARANATRLDDDEEDDSFEARGLPSQSAPPPPLPSMETRQGGASYFNHASPSSRNMFSSLSMRRGMLAGRASTRQNMLPPPKTAPPQGDTNTHEPHAQTQQTPQEYFNSRRLSVLAHYATPSETKPATVEFMNKRRSVCSEALTSSPPLSKSPDAAPVDIASPPLNRRASVVVHHSGTQRTVVPTNIEVLESAEESVLNARKVYMDARKPGTQVERGSTYSSTTGVPLHVSFNPMAQDDEREGGASPSLPMVMARPGTTSGTQLRAPSARPTTARGKHERVAAIKERAGLAS